MTLEQLAAQKCADDFNEEGGRLTKWAAGQFVGIHNHWIRIVHRRLYERIHLAIIAYEAGDKAALDPFRLVEPVDPLVEAMSVAMCGVPGEDYRKTAVELRAELTKRGLEIVETGRDERG